MTSKSAPPPMTTTTWQLMKMAAPIVLFSIILPTVDNVTDLRMIIRLNTGITGCIRTYDLHWQESYTCQEDPITYCKSNPNSTECSYFERYGDPFLIPGCKLIWQNEYTCQEDPATYCQSNPNSDECNDFERYGWVSDIPGCVYFSCYTDPLTYCDQRPASPSCKPIKHKRFATMFLGKYLLFKFSKNFI